MTDFGFTIQQLQATQKNHYLTAASGALVVYDQVLTFSHEVDHIWNRRWSFTTILYFIARYSGDLQVIAIATMYICINWTSSGYLDVYLALYWGQTMFVLSMQAILMLRVHALFNRSKKVLVFLATLYALQTTATFVMAGLLLNQRALHDSEYVTSIGPAIGSITQNINANAPQFWPFIRAMTVLPVAFDAILLFFALRAFIRHTLEAKRLDGGWSINVLVRTLVADQLVYFVCNLTWLSLTLASNYISVDEFNAFGILLNGAVDFFTALVVVAGPRMVISLRAVENNTRGEGSRLEGELSTIRFGVREPPTQSERAMEIGGGFRATDEDYE
ncbi:hypothetical protein BJ138DRAFT_1158469 [Hygrophoropsis aurantiaca]|uniref:Uncharacterized protein n=1 Tax=Hygrophoropsis aurantiaca TaxID=72124 RepID=A0ACB8A4X8_9AGAM|nr:hypothetical protein BJ138DRAFT_1158469 [Hygrophoropsis aurantiaca]